MEGNNHVIEVTDPFVAITEQLERLQSPVTSKCCIYRVPHRLRRLNEAAYLPKVVSIGPLHHKNKDLKKMEEKKMRYLNDFLFRTNVDLRCCVEIVKEQIERLRSCYNEVLDFTNEQLVQIILVDAVFVVENLLSCSCQEVQQADNIRVFTDVGIEFLLLENQLPFFILEDIFNFASTKGYNINISLIDCCSRFFIAGGFLEENDEYRVQIEENYKPEHLVGLLRNFYMPLEPHVGERHETVHTPSVTELHQAGAKLAVGSSNNLLDISFSDGTLKIPKLTISDDTDSILRNLIAYEQCHVGMVNYISDYSTMMDFLINTPKDVELLAHNEIIVNWLGDSSDVSTMINKIGDGVGIDFSHFYFAHLCKDLDSYRRTRWHKWKANLEQNYFNTPWAIVSIIAAVLLLILTMIQTACSIVSTINGD